MYNQGVFYSKEELDGTCQMYEGRCLNVRIPSKTKRGCRNILVEVIRLGLNFSTPVGWRRPSYKIKKGALNI